MDGQRKMRYALWASCFIFLSATLLLPAQSIGFCIDSTLRYKHYNEVCFPTTHNSFNYLVGPKQYIYPNQRYDIKKQLDDGIRAFMIDIHDKDILVPLSKNEVYVFHAYAMLGKEKLSHILDIFYPFLQQHPNEVITLIFDCSVNDSRNVARVFESHPIYSLLYHHTQHAWPLIDTMIQQNQRCVVFTHCNGYSDWYLHQNEYCFENNYNNHSALDYKAEIIRGDTSKALFIMNHFLYSVFQRKKKNAKTNSYGELWNHIQICKAQTGHFPNFLTVDWYDSGDLFAVVKALNERF